jgi:hypothetical protein
VDERADPALQNLKGPFKGLFLVHVRPFDGCRVIDAPVGYRGMPRPERASLGREGYAFVWLFRYFKLLDNSSWRHQSRCQHTCCIGE